MADKYCDFAELSRHETSGIDFKILARSARKSFAIVAPHGGGIEPGTSEIAHAVAAELSSFYAFEGLKARGNGDLHITSTRFNEPICLVLLGRSITVVTIHGEDSTPERVFLGGLDDELGAIVRDALENRGFKVRKHSEPGLQGREPDNICNRGQSRSGVQLELSKGLRKKMFSSLSREGRKTTTPKFNDFVEAVRAGLTEVQAPCISARTQVC